MNHLSKLNKQIEAFITRYYQNELLKGSLFFIAITVTVFLLIIILEYFGRFGSEARAFLLFGFALSFLFLLGKYVAVPFMRITKISKRMDYAFAAKIIGKAIPEVNDKLLNTLQLSSSMDGNSDLLIAALREREDALSVFSFQQVVDFKFNLKYAKYVIPPVLIFLLLLVWDNGIVFHPVSRIVQYQKEFVPPAPFEFNVDYNDRVFAGDPFLIEVGLNGKEIPNELFVEVNGKSYRMKSAGIGAFTYEIPRVAEDFKFQLKDALYSSKLFSVNVLSKPIFEGFRLNVDYPSYTGLEDEYMDNIGDLTVPTGTRLNWEINTKNTNEVVILTHDSAENLQKDKGYSYIKNLDVKERYNYRFAVGNSNRKDTSSVWYTVDILEDKYPTIQVDRVVDSLHASQVFFKGVIKDDYGFSNLQFVVRSNGKDSLVPVKFEKGISQQEFYYQIDFKEQFNDKKDLEYFFLVYDNDRVNGPKKTSSIKYNFKKLSAKEKFDKVDDLNESLKDKLSDQLNKADELNKKFDKFERNLQEKKKLDWNDKNEFKELLKEKKDLLNDIENTKKELDDIMEFSESELQMDEELLEKQKQLEELFDKVMNDEMQELLEELEQMMDEMNKEQLQEELDKMNLDNESLKEELDRNLELFKQLEFEQNFDQMMDRLDELQKKQEELAEEKGDAEELKEKQDELNKEFEEFQKEMEELEKQNEELEEPNDLDFEEQMQQEIQQDMENSSDQLGNKKKKQANKSQQNAAQKMEQMKQKMSQSMASSESQQQEEDMQALRQVMENLMEISFDQEELLGDLKTASRDNPLVVTINKEQKKLKDDFGIVRDSLMALSKRIVQISPEIGRQVRDIDFNMREAIEHLAERKIPEGANNQQYIMTAANNLALLLDEIMQQMQQQMAQNKSGKGNCTKPGQSGQPKMSRMKSLQKQLQKQLQQMKDQAGKGQKGKKKGQKPGQGGQV